MFEETSQPGCAQLSRDQAEETDGLLSHLLPESLTPQLSAHCNVPAARDFPRATLPACLPPSLNSIGFRKHSAKSGPAGSKPRSQAG